MARSIKPDTTDTAETPPTPSRQSAPGRFKRVGRLTTPVISMAHADVLYVKILDKVYAAPMPTLARNGDGTIPCVRVLNLDTGEECTLLCPAVLVSSLQSMSEYVGRSFEIVNGPTLPGKNYRNVEIYEIGE